MATERVKRKISAILSSDVVGYGRLMEEDEVATVRTIESYRKTISSLIEQYNGRVIDSPGDNLLSEFASVVDSVQCAVEIQQVIKARNADLPENRKMEFRIGINLGDVIEEGDRIYGDGINIAARIEGLADAGGICISGSAYDQIASKLALGYENLGEHSVKNIAEPVRVYRIPMNSGDVTDAGIKKAGLKRFQRVALILIGLIIGAGAVTAWFYYFKPSHPPEVAKSGILTVPAKKAESSLSEHPAIAVLPFDNLSRDPDQEYFVDGMTEEIISRLSMNTRLAVIARNSTFFYKGKQLKIQQIGRELGAKYVVEGSVRKAGNRIRITAQLIDADTENHIWAETYDRELKDIFAIQDEIAHQIVAALNIEYRTAERTRAMRIPTENLTAYDSVLRGLSHVLRFTKEENAKARELFERAMGLDPEYALAYMGLGMTYYWDYALGWNTDPGTLERAYESGRTAVSLDDSVSFSHILLTWVYRARGQYEQAILQAQRAVFLNPNDADAYLQMGSILNSVGRSEEALEHIKKAMHLNPHYTFEYMVELAAVYEALGRYEEAIESRKEALVRNPNFPGLYWRLAWSYLGLWGTQQNDDPEILGKALKMAQESVALNGNTSWNHMALSVIFLTRKQHEQAVLEAEKAIAIDPEAGLHGILAHVYNSMGRSEDSIALAEKALERNPEDTGALGVLGHAYRLTGRLEEAAAVAAQQVTSRLDFRLSYERHIELTVLYAELGRIEKAKKEAAEILKLVPHFSVEVWGQRAFYTDQAQTDRDMTALRKAGLK